MTNKEMRFAKLKYQLRKKKENREKEVIWKLSQEQRDFVENVLGHQTIPWIYQITTRPIDRKIRERNVLLKDVHYANKRGQKKIYLKLNRQTLKILDESFVKYKAIKYKIILQ